MKPTAITAAIVLSLGALYFFWPSETVDTRLNAKAEVVNRSVGEATEQCKKQPEACVDSAYIMLDHAARDYKPGTKKYKQAHFEALRMMRRQCESGDAVTCYWVSQGLSVFGKTEDSKNMLAKACAQLRSAKNYNTYELCN